MKKITIGLCTTPLLVSSCFHIGPYEDNLYIGKSMGVLLNPTQEELDDKFINDNSFFETGQYFVKNKYEYLNNGGVLRRLHQYDRKVLTITQPYNRSDDLVNSWYTIIPDSKAKYTVNIIDYKSATNIEDVVYSKNSFTFFENKKILHRHKSYTIDDYSNRLSPYSKFNEGFDRLRRWFTFTADDSYTEVSESTYLNTFNNFTSELDLNKFDKFYNNIKTSCNKDHKKDGIKWPTIADVSGPDYTHVTPCVDALSKNESNGFNIYTTSYKNEKHMDIENIETKWTNNTYARREYGAFYNYTMGGLVEEGFLLQQNNDYHFNDDGKSANWEYDKDHNRTGIKKWHEARNKE